MIYWRLFYEFAKIGLFSDMVVFMAYAIQIIMAFMFFSMIFILTLEFKFLFLRIYFNSIFNSF